MQTFLLYFNDLFVFVYLRNLMSLCTACLNVGAITSIHNHLYLCLSCSSMPQTDNSDDATFCHILHLPHLFPHHLFSLSSTEPERGTNCARAHEALRSQGFQKDLTMLKLELLSSPLIPVSGLTVVTVPVST